MNDAGTDKSKYSRDTVAGREARIENPFANDPLLGMEDYCVGYRISRPTFAKFRQEPDFPPPDFVNGRTQLWRLSKVERYMTRRAERLADKYEADTRARAKKAAATRREAAQAA